MNEFSCYLAAYCITPSTELVLQQMYTSTAAKTHLENLYRCDPSTLVKTVCRLYSGGDDDLAGRLESYALKGWIKFASAILATVVDNRALPISCFLTQVDDTVEGLIEHVAEVSRIAVRGGGLSGDWSLVRPPDLKSPGPVGFMNGVNAAIKAYRQGLFRRGSYAAYMAVSHPSILEFISMRIPGGDADRKNLNLHHAVNITDDFMEAVDSDADWDLVCPKTKEVKQTLKARDLWQMILETRYRTGEPYLNFIDTVNRANPAVLSKAGYKVTCSNLCNEIHLPTDVNITAVCCLSSLNMAEYDAWKETDVVGDLVEMLDNVIQQFIDKAPLTLHKAVRGAELFRPLGVGVLGLAQYYQRRRVPFDSAEAAALNAAAFQEIKRSAVARSKLLAERRGEAPAMRGTGRRNSHLLAVAPTGNAATFLNTSPSVEPWPANAYTNRTKTGSVLIRNPELALLLTEKGKNTADVWQSIILNEGSVQHLLFLSADEKAVFKTAYETDPFEIINQAAARQAYLCQGQSLTLFLPRDTDKATMHKLHRTAWRLGCKGLYYIRTKSNHRVEPLVDCQSCHA